MKFLKMVTTQVLELAMPAPDDTPLGPLLTGDCAEIGAQAESELKDQIEALGGKVLSVEVVAEIIEV